MPRISVLQQAYVNQQKTINHKKKTETNQFWGWRENYRFCLVWVLIGAILSGIAFATILTLYFTSSTRSESISSNLTLRWNSTGITIAGVVGQSGNASNLLYNPFGLYLDQSDTLYIADRGNNRIQKYVSDASFGETVAGQASGVYGIRASFLTNPRDVYVDLNDNLYISDTNNHRIQLWNSGSYNGTTIAGTGTAGNSSNELNSPFSILYDPINNGIYIADSQNSRIMYYSNGIMNGTLVAGGNGSCINNNQLCYPTELHFDVKSNSLIIMNRDANNIVRWTLGASTWTLVAGNMNGLASNMSNGFWAPRYFTMDSIGNIYVADSGNHRIQFFAVGETQGTTIVGTTGLCGSNASLLNTPIGIELDNQLNLYVSELQNHRVQKFMRY